MVARIALNMLRSRRTRSETHLPEPIIDRADGTSPEHAALLAEYISYSDIPPVGGPTCMCIYDVGSHQLVGAWALDHYPHWYCGSWLDLSEEVATNDIASAAASMATHPQCPDGGP